MLIACTACHRQYDVGALAAGERVRCTCGERLTVPAPRSRQAEMLHCSNCGGPLASEARSCEHCDHEVLLADLGYGDPCPECFARLVRGARYCSTCGVEIRPRSALRLAESAGPCPRCGPGSARLARCENERLDFLECLACGGLWLDEEDFLARVREADSRARSEAGVRRPRRRAPEKDVRYLSCPRCGGRMNRENYGRISGVVVDRCPGHGTWFDRHELEHVLAFVAEGGLERARQRRREDERARRARHEAALEGLRMPPLPSPPRAGLTLLDALIDFLSEALL